MKRGIKMLQSSCCGKAGSTDYVQKTRGDIFYMLHYFFAFRGFISYTAALIVSHINIFSC